MSKPYARLTAIVETRDPKDPTKRVTRFHQIGVLWQTSNQSGNLVGTIETVPPAWLSGRIEWRICIQPNPAEKQESEPIGVDDGDFEDDFPPTA